MWNSLRAFRENAWDYDIEKTYQDKNDLGYSYFKATFLVDYDVYITAVVSDNAKSMELDGHLGVLWLEAEYEVDAISFEDLDSMQQGIILAEKNLLNCGVPFTKDYKFHGENADARAERNAIIREALNIDEEERMLQVGKLVKDGNN